MATEKVIEVRAETKDAVKEVEKLNKTTEETGKTAKKTSGDFSGLSGQLDKMTGGAVSGFKGMLASIKGVATGFKTLRGAMIATGLGAFVVILGSLIAAFKGSEEGQNKLNKIMAVTGTLVGNLIDLLADFGDFIISVFENPKKSIKDFSNLIKENIVNRFEGILELIPGLGKAIKKLFKGDFSGAAKTAGDAILKVATGVENYTDKVRKAGQTVKEFIKEQEEEVKATEDVADMRAKADKIERGLLTRRATLENEIAQLRLKSRKQDEFSAEERRQALLDAQKLEDELLDKETEALQLRADAQKMENTFARSNKENLDEAARLEAAVINQKTKKANTARQLQRELNTLSNQISAEEKSRIAEEQKLKDEAEKKEQKRREEAAKVEQELAKATEQARIKNIQDEEARIEAEFQLEIAGIRKKYGEGTELEAELEKSKNAKIAEINEQERIRLQEKRLEQLQLDKDFEQLQFEEKRERLKQQAELIANDEILTQEQKSQKLKEISDKQNAIDKNQKEQEQKREEALADFKIKTAFNVLNSLQSIAEEGSVGAKAIAVAQAVLSTFLGINKAMAETTDFTPTQSLRFANAAAVGISGIANVKKILSTNPKKSSGGVARPSTPSRGASAQQAQQQIQSPEFNIVGDSGTNQIAEVLGQQSKKPQKAFVVSKEVSSQQELDRNIETSASLG